MDDLKTLMRRLLMSVKNKNVKPLSPEEQSAVLAKVLTEFQLLSQSIQNKTFEGKQGRDGKTPYPDVDYISKANMERMFAREIERVQSEVQSMVKDGVDGKDAEITEQDIQKIVRRVAPHTKDTLDKVQALRNEYTVLDKRVRKHMDDVDGRLKRITETATRAVHVAGGGATKNWVIDYIAEHGGGSGTGDMLSTNNLSDVADTSTARTNLGLGNSAVKDTGTTTGTVATGDHNHTGVYSAVDHNHTGVYAPVLGADDNYVTDAEKTVIGNTSGTNTGDEPDASDTVKGIVELATATETTTGTDAGRAVTPDGLAGSTIFGRKSVSVQVYEGATSVATGDGKAYITIPEALNGMNLVRAQATAVTAGTTNATTVMVHNKTDAQDMLSGAISIASAGTVGTAGTINTTYDDVQTNDVLRIDVDSVSTTPPKGLCVVLEFQLA